MNSRNRFQKGSGCYKCKCCGRNTRSTGNGDNEYVQMCEQCYEMGGIENSIADHHYANDEELSQLINEIRFLADFITKHGGVPHSEYI